MARRSLQALYDQRWAGCQAARNYILVFLAVAVHPTTQVIIVAHVDF